MNFYLAIDGGGSKLQIVLFDEQGTPKKKAVAGSINPNFSSEATVKENISTCFFEIFEASNINVIDCVYICFVGNYKTAISLLKNFTTVNSVCVLGEGVINLYAANIEGDGYVALSGTGSHFFLVENHLETDFVGGYGALVCEEGSGYYIGKAGLMAALYQYEKRGQATKIYDYILNALQTTCLRDGIYSIYEKSSPVKFIASLSRCVSQAAEDSDKIAINILEENGKLCAHQVLALIKRHMEKKKLPIVAAGGAWKNPFIFESFQNCITNSIGDWDIRKPIFDPVVGGIIAHLTRNNLHTPIMLTELKQHYSEFVIHSRSKI